MKRTPDEAFSRNERRLPRSFFAVPADARYIICMSTGTGPAKYKCAQCEQPESSCECEKFCCLCQSVIDIRLCNDGLMYCEPCRTACEYKTSD